MPDVTGQLLTTSALVNLYDPATTSINAAVITSAIAGASERMLRHVGNRIINPTLIVTEYQRIIAGMDPFLFTQESPVLNSPAIAVTINGSLLVIADDYVIDLPSGLITRVSSDQQVNWEGGSIKLVYTCGYDTVPQDLEQLASMQVVAELMKIDKKFLGIKQRDPQAGTTLVLEADGLLPSVRQGLIAWKRRASAGGASFG